MHSPQSRHAMQSGVNRRNGVVRALVLLSALAGLAGCTQKLPTLKQVAAPTISTFSASPASIINGSTTTLSWATTGATGIAITPGTFASTSATGSVVLSPTATTTYTLTATNTTGSVTATVVVTVTPDEHFIGRDQHTQLDNFRRDDAEHCAGQPCVDFRERERECEPRDDNDLRVDGDECGGIGDGFGQSDADVSRRAIIDYDDKLPGRNTEHSVCRLHYCRNRRESTVHFLARR